MKKKRIWRWVILAAVILAVIAALALRSRGETNYAQATVTSGDIQTTYSFTGSVVAPRSQTVAAVAGGKVKEVYAQSGDMVEEGDRIMKLSTGELVRAEIDGEIVRMDVQKDDVVTAGQTLVSIADTGRLEAEISVDEYDINAMESGREVEVTVNALGETVTGRLERFDKEATPSAGKTMAAYTAHISFDAPEKTLPGMQVEVRMLNQAAENTLLLKADAIQFDKLNRAYVLTKDAEGRYTETYVETGISDGVNVQILSGLTGGQTVYYPDNGLYDMMMMPMRGGRSS